MTCHAASRRVTAVTSPMASPLNGHEETVWQVATLRSLQGKRAPNAAGTLGVLCTLRLPKPKRPLWKRRFLLTYRRRASVYRISPPSGAHAALKINRRVSPSTRYVYVHPELSDMESGRLATKGRTVSVVPDTS